MWGCYPTELLRSILVGVKDRSITSPRVFLITDGYWWVKLRIYFVLLAAIIAIDGQTVLVYCSNKVYCDCFPDTYHCSGQKPSMGNVNLYTPLLARIHCVNLSAMTLTPTICIDGHSVAAAYCGYQWPSTRTFWGRLWQQFSTRYVRSMVQGVSTFRHNISHGYICLLPKMSTVVVADNILYR